ncbi:hypothetical protein PR048_004459 [Dryococelus australis]|uniref:Uncharacterized protein n=1 Tax=Dryococelus australis TaxID=614101 RepID=A0ABQ9I5H7_9NEOP|nr:hypothetical protein PR048_004459 [Dryococelus australis]
MPLVGGFSRGGGGVSRFPRPFIPALLHAHHNLPHRLSRPPNLFTFRAVHGKNRRSVNTLAMRCRWAWLPKARVSVLGQPSWAGRRTGGQLGRSESSTRPSRFLLARVSSRLSPPAPRSLRRPTSQLHREERINEATPATAKKIRNFIPRLGSLANVCTAPQGNDTPSRYPDRFGKPLQNHGGGKGESKLLLEIAHRSTAQPAERLLEVAVIDDSRAKRYEASVYSTTRKETARVEPNATRHRSTAQPAERLLEVAVIDDSRAKRYEASCEGSSTFDDTAYLTEDPDNAMT